jgi:hypothetical protein
MTGMARLARTGRGSSWCRRSPGTAVLLLAWIQGGALVQGVALGVGASAHGPSNSWLLRRHEEGVLAWFKVPLDNGATEAMNNNAKAVSHRAHGYRTATTFTLSPPHALPG